MFFLILILVLDVNRGVICASDSALGVDLRLISEGRKDILVECVVDIPLSQPPPYSIKVGHINTNFSVLARVEGLSEEECTEHLLITNITDSFTPRDESGVSETVNFKRRFRGTQCLYDRNGTLNRILQVYVSQLTVFDYGEWYCYVRSLEDDEIQRRERLPHGEAFNWLISYPPEGGFEIKKEIKVGFLGTVIHYPLSSSLMSCYVDGYNRLNHFRENNVSVNTPYTNIALDYGSSHNEKMVWATDLYGRNDEMIAEPVLEDYYCKRGGNTSYMNSRNFPKDRWLYKNEGSEEERDEFLLFDETIYHDHGKNTRSVCFPTKSESRVKKKRRIETRFLEGCKNFYLIHSSVIRSMGYATLSYRNSIFNIMENYCKTNTCPNVDKRTGLIAKIKTDAYRFIFQIPFPDEIVPFRISDRKPVMKSTTDVSSGAYPTLLPDKRLAREFYEEFGELLRLFYEVDFMALNVTKSGKEAIMKCGRRGLLSRVVYIANSLCVDREHRISKCGNTEEGRFKTRKIDLGVNENEVRVSMKRNAGGYRVPGMLCMWRVYLCGYNPRPNHDLVKEPMSIWDGGKYI